MGKIRKILETELVGGTQSTDVYPVTSTKAVYDTNNKVLDDYIQHLKKTSTFAGIATPTTNPGTPDGPVFYIAGEGTYANFSNIVIEAGQLGILKWNGTWSKEVLEIGAGGGSGGGSGVSLRTLLTRLNIDDPLPSANGQVLTYNGSNFVWRTPTGGSGSSSRIKNIKLFTNNSDYPFETIELGTADTIGFMQGNNVSLEYVIKDFTNVIKISATGGGSGSSSTTAGKLYFYKDGSEEYWNGESNFKIVFGSGLNVTWDSYSQITLSATGGTGGSGGSTSTSVAWENVTGKPSTFTPSSHTHLTSEITDLSNFKVNNATHADNATKLVNPRLIWGQSFDGTGNINGNLKMGTEGGGSIQLWMNNGNMLDRTNNTLHIGYGLKGLSDGEIDLDAYRTVVYTDNKSKHYDFKSNVFDVNSNQIHFGSETNGGKISWDAANNAFKIEGNVYATGGITALGVSNNATTSNNVDFTFRSVTANTFNVINSIQLSDGLKLERNAGDFDLVSTNGNVNSFYLDGNAENYYLNTKGEAFFSNLDCESLSFNGVQNFEIINAGSITFTIQFKYNNKTYQFTPSEGSVTVS